MSSVQGGDIDLSQFHQVFFEEAYEHLERMEELLIALDPTSPDDESMNAIFRAMHSIKGGSATFGFTEVAEFTHVAENLLDKLRNHELSMTVEMVDALLQSGDITRQQLEARRNDDLANTPDVEELKNQLRVLANAGAVVIAPPDVNLTTVHHAPVLPMVADTPSLAEKKVCVYRISIPIPASGMSQVTRDSLFGDLLMIGTMDEDPEGEPEGLMRFLMHTDSEPSEIASLLNFMASTSGTTVVAYDKASIKNTIDDAAYGFFDDAQGTPKPDAYGFFDEKLLAQQAQQSDQTNTGYGLFEAAPVKVDAAYGFFDNAQGAPKPEAYGLFNAPTALPSQSTSVLNAPNVPISTQENSVAASTKIAATKSIEKPDAKSTSTRKTNEDASIRVSVEKVDELINLVGELVITQAVLLQNANKLDAAQHQQLFAGFTDLERHTRDLQESVMSIRMLPISNVFNRFPRMLRDLATKLNKQVELKTQGEGTELDKGLIERITDPMTHLVRNSLDHGIEMPDVRVGKGKPPQGTITLTAAQRGGNIVIEVSDDGGGLRRDKIMAKARERGLPIAEDAPDTEVWNLIFAPGFSTAEQVTDISGRGVGMDVVKRNIIDMGGTVDIESVVDHGTRITIKLPLTLAIMDGMSVALGHETYVLPLASVVESIPIHPEDLRTISGHGQVLEVRKEYLPILDLREVFNVPPSDHSKYENSGGTQTISVIVEADGLKAALLVDDLLGQQQVVVKNLESNYRKVPCVSGATIMGDGSVALILDVAALVKRSRH